MDGSVWTQRTEQQKQLLTGTRGQGKDGPRLWNKGLISKTHPFPPFPLLKAGEIPWGVIRERNRQPKQIQMKAVGIHSLGC